MTRLISIYPIALAISLVLSVLIETAVAIQVGIGVVLWDRHRGAYFGAILFLGLMGQWLWIIALVVPLEIALIAFALRHRPLERCLWVNLTKGLNAVLTLIVFLRLDVPGRPLLPLQGTERWLPDIYVLWWRLSSSRHAGGRLRL